MGYSFVSVGSRSLNNTTLSPGAPAGAVTGDLLLMACGIRSATETYLTPTGWTALADTYSTNNDGLVLFGRIADGSATDTPAAFDFWTGTVNNTGQICAFTGDVYTNLADIVQDVAVSGIATDIADIPNPALTVTADNCLIIGIGKKHKTNTINGATITSPTGLDNRIALVNENGANCLLVWDYTVQTTASSISASVWDISVDEAADPRPYASLIVALKSSAPVVDQGGESGVRSLLNAGLN
jgi:hypothetical protein